MIKNLIKLANHLDRLKLFKEADILDSAILKLSGDLFTPGFLSEVKEMIADAIGNNFDFDEDKVEEIMDAFKKSCYDTIASAEKTLRPTDGIQKYLDLLHPIYFGAYEQYLIDIFGEDKLDEFSMRTQRYYPEDFISAIDSILEDESGRYLTTHKRRAKNLKARMMRFLDNKFKPTII